MKKIKKNSEYRLRIIETLSHCEDIMDAAQHIEDLLKLSHELEQRADFTFLLTVFGVLSNPGRLKILYSLLEQDRCSCEFEALVGKSQSAVSRDLKIMEDANLIRGWKKGKFIHYSLVKPTFEKLQDQIRDLIESTKNWFGEI